MRKSRFFRRKMKYILFWRKIDFHTRKIIVENAAEYMYNTGVWPGAGKLRKNPYLCACLCAPGLSENSINLSEKLGESSL